MKRTIFIAQLLLLHVSVFCQLKTENAPSKHSLDRFMGNTKTYENFDTLAGCKECQEFTVSGKVIRVFSLEEEGIEDCDKTFNIKNTAETTKRLEAIRDTFAKNLGIKHIDTTHIEIIAVRAECPENFQNKKLNYRFDTDVKMDADVTVTGRLVIEKQKEGQNKPFRPQFEIHPVYSIK